MFARLLFGFKFIVFCSFAPMNAVQVNQANKLIEVPLVRQSNDFTCGAAVAISLLKFMGKTFLESEVTGELGTKPKFGTDSRMMIQFFKEKGFDVRAKDWMTIEELKGCIDEGKPVVCLVQAWDDQTNYSDYWGIGHYVIAIGYDSERIYFMDPWILGNYGYLPNGEFDNRWHQLPEDKVRLNHWGMVVSGEMKKEFKASEVLYIP